MNDYTWPSIFFSYSFFGMCLVFGIYFCVRSWKDGYWNKKSGEEVKYRVFDEE